MRRNEERNPRRAPRETKWQDWDRPAAGNRNAAGAAVALPAAPRTTSHTPNLTSVHATPGRGPYGDPRYRGNCSGLLIRDLLLFYRPRRVLDPMEGGGTCRDVCRELGIAYEGRDLRQGFDATRAEDYGGIGRFDFIWWHPPYFQMVRYNPDDGRCLSNAPTVREFTAQIREVLANLRAVLTDGGKLAILIGDGKHEGKYLGLPFRVMSAAAAEGFWLAAPEIIRFGFGATSARKDYSGSFIPRVHDVCLVLGKTARRPG
jgi:hypothetical protein